MLSVFVYVVGTVVVAAIIFVVAAVLAGRGESLPPVAAGQTLTKLPNGALTGDDARALRFGVRARGYDMAEVDWAIEQLGAEIDRLRGAHTATPAANVADGDSSASGR